ncbi:MAG: DUF1674 domain-containing protein [Proteobacteria bacterium]|nr:DUF1674 domain-containing protein [Pseudomonadota bacterium]
MSETTEPLPADSAPAGSVTEEAPPKPLSPAAQRALAEAAERRAALEAREAELARVRELNGRGGKDPVRYEDWEVKGIATDF